jgi:hypothetical protein
MYWVAPVTNRKYVGVKAHWPDPLSVTTARGEAPLKPHAVYVPAVSAVRTGLQTLSGARGELNPVDEVTRRALCHHIALGVLIRTGWVSTIEV